MTIISLFQIFYSGKCHDLHERNPERTNSNRKEIRRAQITPKHTLSVAAICFFAIANEAKAHVDEHLQNLYRVKPLPSAVQFLVVMNKSISTKNALIGDCFDAQLKSDLTIDGLSSIPAGSSVLGHIEQTQGGCRMSTSMRRGTRRFKNNGSMSLIFDEIVAPNNIHVPITGLISKQKIILNKNTDHPRELRVSKKGEFKKAEDILPIGKRRMSHIIGIAVPVGAGQYAPAVMGAIGAISPSMVLGKPISSDDAHPRLHGMCKGFISNSPGGFIFAPFVFKGTEIEIKEGDEFLIQANTSVLSVKESVEPPLAEAMNLE